MIPNTWFRVYQRIQKDFRTFPKLSFNKLRKTGANWFRAKHSAEVASLYLGHGKKVILDNYTDRPFGRLFRALRRYGKYLREVFDAVAVPFPDDAKKSNTSISLGKIKRIQQLRQQGFTLKKVAELTGVSIQTVQRYTKPAKT